MPTIMIGRTLVLTLALTVGGLVHAQCAATDPEAHKATDEIHQAQLLDMRQTEVVVDAWLPQIRSHIAQSAPEKRWYRLALTVVYELDRYGRHEEAREVLELLAKNESRVGARIRKVALKSLAERDRQPGR